MRKVEIPLTPENAKAFMASDLNDGIEVVNMPIEDFFYAYNQGTKMTEEQLCDAIDAIYHRFKDDIDAVSVLQTVCAVMMSHRQRPGWKVKIGASLSNVKLRSKAKKLWRKIDDDVQRYALGFCLVRHLTWRHEWAPRPLYPDVASWEYCTEEIPCEIYDIEEKIILLQDVRLITFRYIFDWHWHQTLEDDELKHLCLINDRLAYLTEIAFGKMAQAQEIVAANDASCTISLVLPDTVENDLLRALHEVTSPFCITDCPEEPVPKEPDDILCPIDPGPRSNLEENYGLQLSPAFIHFFITQRTLSFSELMEIQPEWFVIDLTTRIRTT